VAAWSADCHCCHCCTAQSCVASPGATQASWQHQDSGRKLRSTSSSAVANAMQICEVGTPAASADFVKVQHSMQLMACLVVQLHALCQLRAYWLQHHHCIYMRARAAEASVTYRCIRYQARPCVPASNIAAAPAAA
jgi:hypothetical protein